VSSDVATAGGVGHSESSDVATAGGGQHSVSSDIATAGGGGHSESSDVATMREARTEKWVSAISCSASKGLP